MKSLSVIFFILSTSFAFAKDVEVVRDSFSFDEVTVTADKVCHDPLAKVLRTFVPAYTRRVCASSTVDRSDSTRPITVCERWETISYPDRVLSKPDLEAITFCGQYDYSDSKYPRCVQWKTEVRRVSLSYRVMIFSEDDYRQERGLLVTRKIPACAQN